MPFYIACALDKETPLFLVYNSQEKYSERVYKAIGGV